MPDDRGSEWEGEAPAEPTSSGSPASEPPSEDRHLPQRKRPASGVFLRRHGADIVYVTVCARSRRPWLATPEVHDLLCSVWREATAWLVGRYVIMPDHVHLFAAPGDIELGKACSPVDVGSAGASPSHGVLGAGGPSDVGSAGASPSRGEPIEVDLDGWVTYWKSQFTKAWGRGPRLWQPRQWDTRLRVGESYESKWDYVRHNPVRHGLVARPEHWPYQGEIFPLDWREPVR